MIQRHVLQDYDPKKFDFFNDGGDTLRWLRMLQTAEASNLAERLQKDYDDYWNSRIRQIKQ